MGLSRFRAPRPVDLRYETWPPVPPEELWFKVFSLNGLGVSSAMNVDGSVTPQSFRVVVPVDKVGIINRVIWHIQDLSIKMHQFAGLGAALANGIEVKIKDALDAPLIDFMDGLTIKVTADFYHLAAVDVGPIVTDIGVDPDTIPIRWSLFKAGYVPYLTAGQYLECRIADDLTGLDHFEGIVQGRLMDAIP